MTQRMKIRAKVKGEPDTIPFIRTFSLQDRSDEEIFFGMAAAVQDKLARKLKINVNEALVVYCALVLDQALKGVDARTIQDSARTILSAGDVMIGVPETLHTVTFELAINGRAERIVLEEPIPIPSRRYYTATAARMPGKKSKER